MGSPQMKTERFELRLDRETLDDVDKWRSEQESMPSRAAAVRQLVAAGLSASGTGAASISDGEKLILMLLRDVLRNQGTNGEIDPDFVAETLWGGHYWALDWKYPGIFHKHVDEQKILTEVLNILEMWLFVESGYEGLSKKEKERVAIEAQPIGTHVEFMGFDGNNEGQHRSIALFLIRRLDRFTNFAGRELDSHMPVIDAYRRMLEAFQPMRATLVGRELSADQIIELLKAKILSKS